MATISIIAEAASTEGGAKHVGRRKAEDLVLTEIEPSILQKSLARLVDGLQAMAEIEDRKNSFRLKQVTAAIEISAEGGISLIGTMKAGSKAAITLTFER